MKGRIFVGVDVGSLEHQVAVMDEKGGECWSQRVANTHAGCLEVLEYLHTWQERGYEVWVGLEGLGGYASPLDRILWTAGIYVMGIHPAQSARFREMVGVQADKTDPLDARLLAEMLRWKSQRGELEASPMRDEYFQALRLASSHFQEANEMKVRVQNQFVDNLRTYWPELVMGKKYFERTDAAGLLALVSRYPTPQALVKAGHRKVEKVLREAMGRDSQELAAELLAQSREVSQTYMMSSPAASVVQEEAAMLAGLMQGVQKWERVLTQLLELHPFGQFMLDQAGLGPRTSGCFLGEVGDLGEFKTEAKLARYAGIGPVVSQSGKQPARHHDGHRYNHCLKRTVMLMARSRALHDERSKAYVAKRRALGDGYWKAIKKLARYLLRFLWKSWQQIVQKNEINLEKILAQGALLP